MSNISPTLLLFIPLKTILLFHTPWILAMKIQGAVFANRDWKLIANNYTWTRFMIHVTRHSPYVLRLAIRRLSTSFYCRRNASVNVNVDVFTVPGEHYCAGCRGADDTSPKLWWHAFRSDGCAFFLDCASRYRSVDNIRNHVAAALRQTWLREGYGTGLCYLLPPYSQNGTLPSFCARYGGLNEYLYSNFRCGVSPWPGEAAQHIRKTKSHLTSAAIFISTVGRPTERPRRAERADVRWSRVAVSRSPVIGRYSANFARDWRSSSDVSCRRGRIPETWMTHDPFNCL